MEVLERSILMNLKYVLLLSLLLMGQSCITISQLWNASMYSLDVLLLFRILRLSRLTLNKSLCFPSNYRGTLIGSVPLSLSWGK